MKSLVFDYITYGTISILIGVWVYFLSHTSLFASLLSDIIGEENQKTSQVTLSLLITPSNEKEEDEVVSNNNDIDSNKKYREGWNNRHGDEFVLEDHEIKLVPVIVNNYVGGNDISGDVFGQGIVQNMHNIPGINAEQLIQTGRKY